jgi:hypothetical protein
MIIYALNKISNMYIAIEEKIKTTDSNLNTTVNSSIKKLPQKHATYKQYGKFIFNLEENFGMPEMISSFKSLYLITCLLYIRYFLMSFIFSILLCLVYFYFFLLIKFLKIKNSAYQYDEKYKKYTKAITVISFIILCVILYLYPLINSFINYLPLLLILINIIFIDLALSKKDKTLIYLLLTTIYSIVFILIFSIFDAGKRAIGFQDPERTKKLEEEERVFIETEIEKKKLFKHIESIWLGKEIHIKSKYFLALLFYWRAIFFYLFIHLLCLIPSLFFNQDVSNFMLIGLLMNIILSFFINILISKLKWLIIILLFSFLANKSQKKKPRNNIKEKIFIIFYFILAFAILPLFKSFRENLFIFDY